MVIWLRNLQKAVQFSEPLLTLHCNFLLNLLGAGKYHVNVVCLDAKEIQILNKKYRGINSSTDVLSFPYHEGLSPGELPAVHQEWDYNLGDIILGMTVIQQVCAEEKVHLKDRLPVLVTHGLCHLLGYHHSNQHCWKLGMDTPKQSIIPGHDEWPTVSHYHDIIPIQLLYTQQMYCKESSILSVFNRTFGTNLTPLTGLS